MKVSVAVFDNLVMLTQSKEKNTRWYLYIQTLRTFVQSLFNLNFVCTYIICNVVIRPCVTCLTY